MSPPPTTSYHEDELAIPPFRPRAPSEDVAAPTATPPRPAAAAIARRAAPPPPSRPTPTSRILDYRTESRLGQYRIIKTVGEGSFGKVKLAIHEVTGQKVALKMISRKNLTSRDMAGRVEREIAYLQLLRHPHIIKLYTVITTPAEIIMVIEYAGGELFDFLVSTGKVPEDSARRFFQQIICAVEYCHRHKIVHRDLKPENLLLDSNLNVKIADFGLSNIMTDGNFLKTSCGSPNYAAPEVIGGKLYAGPEVDVWSCGVILFVLLCGKLPFDDDYIPNLFKKISQGKYSMPSYLSPDAKDLISRMLIVNPIQRITIAEIRKHPWFKRNLPEYLQPPKEEFFDTGVDVTNIPQLEELERGPAERLKGELHDAVVGKLGSTMGYAKDDVQDALTKNEPSAIKDAYMIVRENQMMIPRLSMNAKNDGFMAQSPPAWDSGSFMPGSPRPQQSPHNAPHWAANNTPSRTGSPLALNPSHSPLGITTEEENLSASPQLAVHRSPASSISVLPSSVPAYHQALMSGTRRFSPVPPPPAKRSRQTKWQFGIRSRNAPLEAVGCIYRALKRLGAEWVDTPPPSPSSPSQSDDDGDGDGDDYGFDDLDNSHVEHTPVKKRRSTIGGGEKAPKDPWIIQARWRKFAPMRRAADGGGAGGKETGEDRDCVFVHLTIQLYQLEHDNYLVDFKCAGYERLQGGGNSGGGKSGGGGEGGKKKVGFEETLGGDVEGTLRVDSGDGAGGGGGGGRRAEDQKEVNSPFPFLDAAGALIIALAEAGD